MFSRFDDFYCMLEKMAKFSQTNNIVLIYKSLQIERVQKVQLF